MPQFEAARVKALELLQKHVMWWEPAYIGAAHRDLPELMPYLHLPFQAGADRIRIERMTGHRATPDRGELAARDGDETKVRDGWWSEILRHIGVCDPL